MAAPRGVGREWEEQRAAASAGARVDEAHRDVGGDEDGGGRNDAFDREHGV